MIMDNNEKDIETLPAEEPVNTEAADVEIEESAPEAQDAPIERSADDLARKRKKEFWDRITTFLLILVLCSPIMILLYILMWFLNRG